MRYVKELIIRVLVAIALLVLPINVFYFLFSKITLWGSLPILYLLGYSVNVEGYTLLIDGQNLEFIPACVATSAYYLLALLVLLTKDLKLKMRLFLFLLGSLMILTLNIIRIDILLYVLLNLGENWFEKFHIFFWQFLSSVYVAAVWIFLTYKFKIKFVPVYSDLKFLLSQSIFGKKRKKTLKKKPKKTRAH